MFFLGFLYCILMAYFLNHIVEPRIERAILKESGNTMRRKVFTTLKLSLVPFFFLSTIAIELFIQYFK